MPMPDPAKCLSVIKCLEKDNEKLKSERDSALQNLSLLQDKIRQLEKTNNDLKAKELIVSTGSVSGLEMTPVAENVTINKLTSQNCLLRNKLQEATNFETVQETVDKSDLQEAVNHYKNVVSQKNNEIALLKKTNDNHELARQVAFLNQLLQRTIAVNNAYSKDIISLQEQLGELGINYIQETKAQTVSGDQDIVSTISEMQALPFPKEVQLLKEENSNLKEQIEKVQTKNKELHIQIDSLMALNLSLEEQILDLKSKNSLLSTSKDFPMDSQMKIFLDDFYDERKEKEKQFKENQEMKVENSRLKQRCNALMEVIRTQDNPSQNPILQHQTSLPPNIQYKGVHDFYYKESDSEHRLNISKDHLFSLTHDKSINKQTGEISNLSFHQPRFEQPSGIVQRQETPRTIGFPQSKFRSPTSPPSNQNISFAFRSQGPMNHQNRQRLMPPRYRPAAQFGQNFGVKLDCNSEIFSSRPTNEQNVEESQSEPEKHL